MAVELSKEEEEEAAPGRPSAKRRGIMYFFHDLYAHRLWAQRHATVGLISTYQLGFPGEKAR